MADNDDGRQRTASVTGAGTLLGELLLGATYHLAQRGSEGLESLRRDHDARGTIEHTVLPSRDQVLEPVRTAADLFQFVDPDALRVRVKVGGAVVVSHDLNVGEGVERESNVRLALGALERLPDRVREIRVCGPLLGIDDMHVSIATRGRRRRRTDADVNPEGGSRLNPENGRDLLIGVPHLEQTPDEDPIDGCTIGALAGHSETSLSLNFAPTPASSAGDGDDVGVVDRRRGGGGSIAWLTGLEAGRTDCEHELRPVVAADPPPALGPRAAAGAGRGHVRRRGAAIVRDRRGRFGDGRRGRGAWR
jgi:hypothetical protein